MSVNFTSNSSLDTVHCASLNSKDGESIITALYTTRLVLLIPISIAVLYLGVQQWRQQRSFKTASHSDIFTYNVAVMELMWSLGTILYYLGVFSDLVQKMTVGFLLLSIIFYGETSFHVLTCVDRYLAVVHPVKYRDLRNTHGVTIRNIGIFCVWLMSFLLSCISSVDASNMSIILFFNFLVISLAVVFFCSFSVLHALFRPGPGAGGGNRGHTDQSKQRAFYTVMAIMGVLCLFFLGFLVSTAVMISNMCKSVELLVYNSLLWLTLPSNFVLPLLYLHRTGKLPCTNQSRRSRE